MKKTIALVTLAALVLVAAASFASAAPAGQPFPCPRFGGPQGEAGPQAQPVTLTDDQKKELAPLYDKMLDVKKEMLQKYVSFGYLTQEQADQRAAWMKERMAWHRQHGSAPGMMGRGPGMGGQGPGFGPGGRGPCGQQTPAANQ